MTTAQDGGKVSLTHRPPLPPGNTPGTHFCSRLSRPQGHTAIGSIMSMKNPLTPAGIEPATFRFVAQQLNNCAVAVRWRGSYEKYAAEPVNPSIIEYRMAKKDLIAYWVINNGVYCVIWYDNCSSMFLFSLVNAL